MTVELQAQGRIVLAGRCPSEDAETLLQHLLASPLATVDWSACESAHTAVIQVLLAAKPRLLGPPMNPFLAQSVEPLLESSAAGGITAV